MQTGEDLHALRKIIDFVRFGSLIVMLMHFYCFCYPSFHEWGFTCSLSDRIIFNLTNSIPFLGTATGAKTITLLLLSVTLIAAKGRKDDKLKLKPLFYCLASGIAIYYLTTFIEIPVQSMNTRSVLYILLTVGSYLTILDAGTKLSRYLPLKTKDDIFNDINETFPQEENLIENEYSFNLPAQYYLKGKLRRSYVNIPSPFRSVTILGSAGAGKTFFVLRQLMQQAFQKGYTQFIFDYKYPDLTKIALYHCRRNVHRYKNPVQFYVLDFDNLSRSHRCNPIHPSTLNDLTDATESSRAIMLALNKQWLTRQGDFFVESPINFITAIFWFLRNYEGGRYCTLPHAIELAQIDYRELWPVLSMDTSIEVLINPFVSAYLRSANEQLEGQIASAKIGLARLASPSIYYVLSGNDFTLDLNNPDAPKIICAGNNPMRQQIYGAVLSLYIERMLKVINKAGQLPSAIFLDEFPTIVINNIDQHIATARSRLCATVIGLQDLSQTRRDYGRDQAEVIINSAGNIISGQVFGDTAKLISDRIGRIMQERESISINSQETSISKSSQLESAIPPSRISNLSSGEFVGAVADTPFQKIKRKSFHCEFLMDYEAIKKEEVQYEDPPVIREVTDDQKLENFYRIKQDIKDLISTEMQKIKSSTSSAQSVPNNSEPTEPVSL